MTMHYYAIRSPNARGLNFTNARARADLRKNREKRFLELEGIEVIRTLYTYEFVNDVFATLLSLTKAL